MGDCAIFPSSARRGGRAIKKKFPFRYGAAGVVRSAKTWARRSDHPVCAASVASRLFINGAATPPVPGGEYARLTMLRIMCPCGYCGPNRIGNGRGFELGIDTNHSDVSLG